MKKMTKNKPLSYQEYRKAYIKTTKENGETFDMKVFSKSWNEYKELNQDLKKSGVSIDLKPNSAKKTQKKPIKSKKKPIKAKKKPAVIPKKTEKDVEVVEKAKKESAIETEKQKPISFEMEEDEPEILEPKVSVEPKKEENSQEEPKKEASYLPNGDGLGVLVDGFHSVVLSSAMSYFDIAENVDERHLQQLREPGQEIIKKYDSTGTVGSYAPELAYILQAVAVGFEIYAKKTAQKSQEQPKKQVEEAPKKAEKDEDYKPWGR